jgi:hypothetical protein
VGSTEEGFDDDVVVGWRCGDVRSNASGSRDESLQFEVDFVGWRGGDEVRSSVSRAAGGAEAVLLRREDARGAVFISLDLEDADCDEVCDAFDDIDVNGERFVDGAAVRRGFAGPSCAEGTGDESVRSRVSTSSNTVRSFGGAGIGAALMAGVEPRSFVGVAEARQASRVVCLDFPGDDRTEVSRDALAGDASFVRVFAFLASSLEGEGWTGESTRSKVSIGFRSGGVDARSNIALVSAGSVFDRCIGARLLLFVTLGGSSNIGDSDFSRSGIGTRPAV